MIHILPEHVINQIAAGEVVERPASIVKELVENSLDAGATHISVHLRNGGKSLIRISDNGKGIEAQELPLAVLRHATSKISQIEDLDNILTLGFRGEALASIASVSSTYIESKTAPSTSASTITIDHGNIEQQATTAREQGTTVNIENLFAKIPARRKFLKSDKQELSTIVRLMQEIALSRPDVHFEVVHNGQELINTPAKETLLERFYDLFPTNDLQGEMLPIHNEEGSFILDGVISSPVIKRRSRATQMISVNGRTIHDYRIAKCIEDAYHGFLITGEHPLFFIHLYIPTDEIDVNVHPRKTEVRFSRTDEIMSFVYRSIKSVLESRSFAVKTHINSEFGVRNAEWNPNIASTKLPRQYPPSSSYSQSELLTPNSALPTVHSPQAHYHTAPEAQLFDIAAPLPIRFLAQIKNSYILCSAENSLILFDQHAAHERFIYEQLKKFRAERSSQELITPIEIKVSAEQSALLSDEQNVFADFGIFLEQAAPNQWLITEVPNMPKSHQIDWSNVVLNTLETVHQESLAHTLVAHEEDLLHTMACKAAVKFNDKLTPIELQRLIDDVAYLPGIYTCPHGRPFRLEITFNELDRYFKRH